MTTSTTNRFLTKALRLTCCAVALTACSAWAAVVDWQLSPMGANGSIVVFERAAAAAATLADALNENPTTRVTDIEESESALSQDSAQISTGSTQPADSFLVADLQPQPVLQSGGALAHAFDEEFVSVPTVQFASMASGSKDLSGTSMAAVSTDPAPVPEMSALFPIIGLIAAVSCTQILRRRRAAQQSAPRSLA